MTLWICTACGLEHADTPVPPSRCVICDDERQYVPLSGQSWTTSERLQHAGTSATVIDVEPRLHRMLVKPDVGIGHQPLLIQTSGGNLLWEPPGYIDADAVAQVQRLGGLAAITGSHPHLMGAMVSWSRAFDNAPVYVAEPDKDWTRRPDPVIAHWSGEANPLPGIRLVQCGGHFPGSSVLHWADEEYGIGGRGVILTGDTIFIGPDNMSVSTMRSYPNRIPLPERAVRQILERLEPLEYDRAYGSFGQVIDTGAKNLVKRSLRRYIAWVRGDIDDY